MLRKITLIFFTTVALFCLGVYFLYTDKLSQPLISPVLQEGRTVSVNQWFPKLVLGAEFGIGPQITARSALFIDSKTGEVLYSKNFNDKLPIASLAKVMTVLVALDQRGMEEKMSVSHRAAEYEPDKMFLVGGEKLTLKELLYGVFLVSANDAAEVISENTTGRREEFIQLMNAKASQLGMKDTLFVNPTGLDEDFGNTYSSVYDLAILARHLIKTHPEVVEISSTPYINIPATPEHQNYELFSGINLLTTYPGVVGFKTGYTPEAGYTLITLAQKNGKEIIGVLLGSENRREEAKELLDYSFGKLGNL